MHIESNRKESRARRTKTHNARPTIGLLTGRISGELGISTLVLGVADAAEEGDANVITFVGGSLRSPHGFEAQGNVLYDLVAAGVVDGLAVDSGWLGHHIGPEAMRDFCARYDDVPVVSVEVPIEGISSVLVDFYQGMRGVITHLIEVHGYRRIAFIRGPEESLSAEERYRAYQDALAEHDIPLDMDLVVPGTFFEPSGEEAVRLLLDERKVAFEAVAAANDLMALNAMQALQARGISVPDDVAVTGFDDEPITSVVTPPLTTARLENYERSRQAGEMLLAQLRGEQGSGQVVLPAEVVVRQSCGCPSLAVVEAASGPVRGTGEAIEVALTMQREQILSEMAQRVGPSAGQAGRWAEQLLDALSAELGGESTGAFLSALAEVLSQVAAAGGDPSTGSGQSVTAWQGALSVLRRYAVPSLGNHEALSQADDLWQQARVMIGEAAERIQLYRSLQSERRAEVLREVGEVLIATHDVAELMDTLVEELPRLGVRSCYLSLYEDPGSPAEWSRLALAYSEGERVVLEEGRRRFASRQLVPEGLLPDDRRYHLIVEPLYFREGQIGFALFEFEGGVGQEGSISEALRGQLSSALKGASLVQQEEKRARQLQTIAEVSTATSTILEADVLLQQMADLTKERFGLYHAHIYLLSETKDALHLAAGAGRAGRQMVAEGWHIPLAYEQSLVARAARSGEVTIENNVRESDDWSPNPLLPDTYAEMAVPIMLEESVMGVLGVQSDKIGGLNEVDANLLRSLANHVAVALANARLFEETTRSKEEAELAQEKAEQARVDAEQAKKEVEIANQTLETQIWQTTGQAQLNDKMRGEQDMPTLANNVIQQLCHYLEAQVGALYVAKDQHLNLISSYAYSSKKPTDHFKFGEGLVGQTALEKRPMIVTNVSNDHMIIRSGFSELVPRSIMVFPLLYEDRVVGVAEMGTLTEFTETQMEFIETALNSIAIAFNTAQARARINELLHETQQQAEELQAQGEELRVTNEELEAQTEILRASETELMEKQAILDEQNRELKVAQQELETKAKELAQASQYKSEFLSNMSHELRTPLNSLLILARMLADNEEGNLTEDQIESAQVIYGSGNDLLNLINDILDLSKVEAGKMTFTIEPMYPTDLVTTVRTQFTHVAEEKGLDLNITLADDLPVLIETDQQRVNQIVKNLLSNAFKFTSEGSVGLDISRPDASVDLSQSGLDPTQAIAISVTDTGIGMTYEQQSIVFEAFQQADGSTSRLYGGTGLGLSISRELAAKLGGQITLESEVGRGSTFTLYLPIAGPWGTSGPESAYVSSAQSPRAEHSQEAHPEHRRGSQDIHQKAAGSSTAQVPSSPAPVPPDDRADLEAGDRTLLVIEDDPRFAKIVYDYAHQQAFKCLIAGDGRTGLELVKTYRPEAVILDLNLPDISGWEVLEILKNDPDTRHIPVHIMSVDEEVLDAYRKGAMGYLTKPVSRESLAESFQNIEQFISREIKTLLLVEDDAKSRSSIKKLLGGSDVEIVETDHGQAALDLLKAQQFDCMIVDLNLPDMTGFEVLSKMNGDRASAKCPVIVYTGRDLSPEENHELMKYADSVIVKGVKSPERLLDETSLFLHRVVADMPKAKQQTIKQLYNGDAQLEGKKILIVDDDMRNSFALSKLLSDKGIDVKIAQSGQKALDMLAEHSDTDLVLMDIMMPVMDGYEATRRIRDQQRFKTLPILALTAKAMKGDREKCLEAGASDYLPKPVDVDRLFSMLRVWLYQ